MTATEKALTSRETNSALGTWATEFEAFLQATFETFQKFRGQEFPEDGVSVNKEYNLGVVNAEEGNLLLSMKDKGVLSSRAAFDEFRRRGLVDEALDWTDIEAENEDAQRKATTGVFGTLAGGMFGNEQGTGNTGTENT
jgi:hypothetical protein